MKPLISYVQLTFAQNMANFGGALKYSYYMPQIDQCVFKKNIGKIEGNDRSSYPRSLAIDINTIQDMLILDNMAALIYGQELLQQEEEEQAYEDLIDQIKVLNTDPESLMYNDEENTDFTYTPIEQKVYSPTDLVTNLEDIVPPAIYFRFTSAVEHKYLSYNQKPIRTLLLSNAESGNVLHFPIQLRILNDNTEVMLDNQKGQLKLSDAQVSIHSVNGSLHFDPLSYFLEGDLQVQFDVGLQSYVFDNLRLIGIPGGPIITLAFTA